MLNFNRTLDTGKSISTSIANTNNLLDIKDTENGCEDCGINAMTDEELSLYDGYIAKNGIQICLFGRISNNCNENSLNDFKAAIFEKLTIEELRNDANAEFRRYDR